MNSRNLRKQVEALVKSEWRQIEATVEEAGGSETEAPPGDFTVWSECITPAFPAHWPPDGKGVVHYYAYASGFSPGRLADAEFVAAPWARVTVGATGQSAPQVKILSRRIKEIGIQGVRPLKKDEIAVAQSQEAVEEQLYTLSTQTIHGDVAAPLIKHYYKQWCALNGTVAEQIRPFHRKFFDWLGCK